MNPASAPCVLTCDRLVLGTPDASMAPRLLAYLLANRERFAAAGPKLEAAPSLASTLQSIQADLLDQQRGTGIRFYLFERDGDDAIIGNVSLSNIVMGVFQACHLGYRIDAHHEGQGLMREALARVLDHAFDERCLHRVMANYAPTNARSAALLRRLGFAVEGYARDYLFLDGAWQDHVLTSLVRPAKAG